MKALGEHSDVPVPVMHVLCEDEAVLGTSFYVMDFVPGRVFTQPQLEALPKDQRADLYNDKIDTLAKLHSVDYQAAGLGRFRQAQGLRGAPGEALERPVQKPPRPMKCRPWTT